MFTLFGYHSLLLVIRIHIPLKTKGSLISDYTLSAVLDFLTMTWFVITHSISGKRSGKAQSLLCWPLSAMPAVSWSHTGCILSRLLRAGGGSGGSVSGMDLCWICGLDLMDLLFLIYWILAVCLAWICPWGGSVGSAIGSGESGEYIYVCPPIKLTI